MVIPAIRMQSAVDTFIESKGNKTLTYQAAHPGVNYDVANKNANPFMVKYGIEEKAAQVLSTSEKLEFKNIILSLEDEVQADKSTLYKGKEYISPDYPTRLQAKKFIISDIYGVGRRDNTGDVYNDNRAVLINVDIKQLAGITSELRQLTTQANNIITKLDKNKDI